MRGREVDLHAATDPERAAACGVAPAAVLRALADAMAREDEDALTRARQWFINELGPAQLVDAAAVVSNFERMVRIADATSIPLDDPLEIMSSDVREQRGINRFTAPANT